jgi:hypothetical protein
MILAPIIGEDPDIVRWSSYVGQSGALQADARCAAPEQLLRPDRRPDQDLKTREACAASITQVPKTALALELARLDRRALATSNP